MLKIKTILVLLIMVMMSGCCMPYKRYFKKVDAVSMELREMQRDLSNISKKSREIDSIISSGQGSREAVIKMDSIKEDVRGMKKKMQDIHKAIFFTRVPCNRILKPYHEKLIKLLLVMSEARGRITVSGAFPIKIELKGKIETITMSKLKEYETFLPDIEQVYNYFLSLDLFFRSYKFKILGRNFYAYSLDSFEYKDKKGKPIYTYIVKKREINQVNMDSGYIAKLKKKIMDYEDEIKNLLSSLIKTRDDFNLFIAEKKAGKK